MRRFTSVALTALSVLALCLVIAYHQLTDDLMMNATATARATIIEYSDGTIMAKLGDEDRIPVPLSRMAASVGWAVVAAEDRDFFHESGFSITGTARAVVSDAIHGTAQGGSGITQQYVKNAYLTQQRSLIRKVRELAIAVKLDAALSKSQILEDYLNTVYFGRGAYGVEAASQAYFDVHAVELSVSQSAFLAALLRAPSYYGDPNHRDAMIARWQYVVNAMTAAGHLNAVEKLSFPTTIRPEDAIGVVTHGPTALIVQRIVAELAAHGVSEAAGAGLVIRTTIDRRLQSTTVAEMDQFVTESAKAAALAIDPRSGGVLAYYGGAGPRDGGPSDYFDWAGVGCRPAGAAFEPFVVATALSSQRFNGPNPASMDALAPTAPAVATIAHASGVAATCAQTDPGRPPDRRPRPISDSPDGRRCRVRDAR